MPPTPILFLSDSPSATSGLGRITRELATRLHENCYDIFRVACFGYGGPGSRSLPFMQYNMEGMNDWFLPTIHQVWDDWSGGEPGIIFTIWDPSRLLWFTRPEPYCQDRRLRSWLKTPPFLKWGYIPIDAEGPEKKLSVLQKECLQGYDRLLAYTGWGEKIIAATLGLAGAHDRALTYIPHGIDTKVFEKRDKEKSRRVFHEAMGFKGPAINPAETIIGIVGTNQARKDYGQAIAVVAEISKKIPVRLFIQIDALERFWSIPQLLHDFGLLPFTIVNCGEITDKLMSIVYSACDVTFGIGLGEGFGYPIFESLACGTPCISGDYGGQAEFMDPKLLVRSSGRRIEGLFSCYRPVYSKSDWVRKAMEVISLARTGKLRVGLPVGLDWENNWKRWEKWFREAHQSFLVRVETQVQTSSMLEKDKERLDLHSQSTEAPELDVETLESQVSGEPSPESV